MATPGGTNLFFDTTEVAIKDTCLPRFGKITDERLRTAATAIDARLYVADLVVEEVVFRRWRYLQRQLEEGRKRSNEVARYARIDIPVVDEKAIQATFRKELYDVLSAIPIAIISTNTVMLSDVLELSLHRVPPFVRPDNPTGFHDAVVLLASLKHAQSDGLDEIFFVSQDNGHQEAVVKRIGDGFGVSCQLVRGTDSIVERMETLHAAHLQSMRDHAVTEATEFVNQHRGVLQDFLRRNPPSANALGVFFEPVIDVRIDLTHVEAIPEATPTNGQQARLNLFARGRATITTENRSPFATGYFVFSTSSGDRGAPPLGQILGSSGEPLTRTSTREIDVELTGALRALFDGGKFTGAPIVENLQPRAQTNLFTSVPMWSSNPWGDARST